MSLNTAKQSLNTNKQQLLHEVYHVPQETVLVVGEPVSNSVPKVPTTCLCYHRCRKGEGSVSSKCSFFSIGGFITYMSILACTSVCAFASINSAFSILSLNSVGSVASVNSVLSIGSVNCFECVFNVPIRTLAGRTSNTCKKYSLVDGADENNEKLLFGLTYRTFQPAAKPLSEADLANDCCLYIHSTEAKEHNLKGFILNSDRTACLVYSDEKGGANGAATLARGDVDTAKHVYKPCPPGAICQ
jgi:hypothetical protein